MDPNKYYWMKDLAPNGVLDQNQVVNNLMSKSLKLKNEVIELFENVMEDLSAKNSELFDEKLNQIAMKNNFDYKEINTFEPLLASIICNCLD